LGDRKTEVDMGECRKGIKSRTGSQKDKKKLKKRCGERKS
jgi:hypothetical protein